MTNPHSLVLPNGWKMTTLEEIAEIILGQSPPSSTYNLTGEGLPFYQGKSEFGKIYPIPKKYCTSPNKIAEKGDVLISVRAPVGPTNICPEKSCIGRGLAAIHPLGDINSFFILYLIRAFEKELSGKGTGTTFNAIRGNQLREFEISLPPFSEQGRIVCKLEELFTRLDAGVESLRKVKAQLQLYRQAVLKHAFNGKLTEEWRKTHKNTLQPATTLLEQIKQEPKLKQGLRYKEPLLVDSSKLSEIPEEWCWVTLSELGELNRGKSKHRPRNDKSLFGGKYPFIQTGDVRNSDGIIRSYSQTYNEQGLKQSRLWNENTLCITIAANIAETAILGIPACFPDSIVGFIADEQVSQVKYVHYFIKSVKNRLDSVASATAQKNINLSILRKVAVPFTSISEQNKIIEEIERRLSIANEVEKVVEQSLQRSVTLRNSILKIAFEGGLVAQNLSDKPAQVLLERITKQKEKTKGNSKKRVKGV